jgi:hypothetical protein
LKTPPNHDVFSLLNEYIDTIPTRREPKRQGHTEQR